MRSLRLPDADSAKGRLAFLGVLVAALFLLLVARLWFLQVMVGGRFVERAEGQAVRTIPIEAPRGAILDRDGVPLVRNRFAQVVSVRPEELGDRREEIVADLADLLGMPAEEIGARIDDARAGAFASRPIAIDVDTDIVFYIHENGATRYPGVYAERLPLREYPGGDLAAHVLGYTGEISPEELEDPEFEGYRPGDIIGWAGVERSYEAELQGERGERRVQVNARGHVLGDVEEIPPQPGDDLQLTIDAEVQQLVEEALEDGIDVARGRRDSESGAGRGGRFAAPAGAVVVLDPDNGEVVAMASYPTFQPVEFVGGVSRGYWDYLTDEANSFPLINRAVGSSYPPGSVFKIVTASAALANNFTEQDEFIPCPAQFEWNDSVYRNWKPENSGSLNIAESLEQSCDTVYYALAREMFNTEVDQPATGADVFEYLPEMARAYGMGAVTGIDLPGERAGVVPGRVWRRNYWENARDTYCAQAQVAPPGSYAKELFSELCAEGWRWRGGDLVNMSIGQGDLQTTPLQVATSFAAVATRGTIIRPHVVRAVLGRDGGVRPVQPEVLTQVPVSADDLAYIESGLRRVTGQEGTAASVFANFPIELAGKTGTAESKPKQPFAWFGAYNIAPVNGQRYVVVALVEEGGSGSATAAPIVKRVFQGLLGLEQTAITAGVATD